MTQKAWTIPKKENHRKKHDVKYRKHSRSRTWNPAENCQANVNQERAGAATTVQADGNGRQENSPEDLTTIHQRNRHFGICVFVFVVSSKLGPQASRRHLYLW